MLKELIVAPTKKHLKIAPFIGIGCPGVVEEDGSIDRGAQNLPGNSRAQPAVTHREVVDRRFGRLAERANPEGLRGRDRAQRAEQWLNTVYTEIEKRSSGTRAAVHEQPHGNASRHFASPGFLSRLEFKGVIGNAERHRPRTRLTVRKRTRILEQLPRCEAIL